MIYGIGVDTVEINRMEKSMAKQSFKDKVFSPAELEYFAGLSGRRLLESSAANFAAKEAFLKACGRGLGGFKLSQISVLREESGRPYYIITGEAGLFCSEKGIKCHVSLSHDGGIATALALLEVQE